MRGPASHALASLTWIILLATGGCGTGVPADAVAVYDGGHVTAVEAERFLRWFDPRRLKTDAAVDADQGVEQVLAELAFLEVLANEAPDEPPAETPLYVDQRGSLLVRYYVERTGKRSHEVTDDEAMAYYREHLDDRFSVPESAKFQHVFLRADRHPPEEVSHIERLILDRLAAGTPFAELAAAHSDSDSATREGVVGPVYRGRMEPTFEDQLYRLEPGQPGIVRTPQGTHVVVVLEKRPAEVQTFESAKRQIVNAIMNLRNQAERDQLLETLRARYGVEDHSAESDLGPEEVVVRVKEKTMTRAQLDSHLTSWLSAPGLVDSGAANRRQLAVGELITANLLYLDAVDRGLDREQEFLDRWAVRELRRRSNISLRRRLDVRAQEVPEEEVLRYFQENQGRFAVPQRFQGSFLFQPFGSGSPFDLQQRVEQLADLAASPEANPADVERQCAEAGVTLTEMGWITPLQAARVGPEFQRRLLALTEPGSTGAFKDEGGLYVILVRAVEARRAMVLPGDLDLVRARYVDLRRDEIVAEMRRSLLEERRFKVVSTAVFANADANG